MRLLRAQTVYVTSYETFANLTARLPQFIEHVYNAERMHSELGYISILQI